MAPISIAGNPNLLGHLNDRILKGANYRLAKFALGMSRLFDDTVSLTNID